MKNRRSTTRKLVNAITSTTLKIMNATFITLLFCASAVIAQQPPIDRDVQRNSNSNHKQVVKIELLLRTRAECPSNLLLLSDLVRVEGSDALVHQVVDLPLAPAPRIGNDQIWTRQDIEKTLALRGLSAEMLRWGGAMECSVRRVDGPRIDKHTKTMSDANIVNKAPITAQLMGHQELLNSNETPVTQDAARTKETIDKSQFTAPFTTPATISQAERVAASAIENYLQTKTASAGRWNIGVSMPTEHAKMFAQRRQILGITGGRPPWEGKQDFVFLIMGPAGEQSISLSATVKLPEMVVAAKAPLSKGYVLREEDLVWIPMPRGLSFSPEECFSQTETLIGQQLRRAMSTQQVIRLNEVGPPMIIHVGDLVGIGIVSGGVIVETNGRAIESGALDDLIQIEVQPHKKRVLARVIGDRSAEVIANGAANTAPGIRNKPTTTNTSSSITQR